MSLDVKLLKNSSPKNKINKSLSDEKIYACFLKDRTSILRPSIILETSDALYQYNYMYIPDLGRYYFIDDIISIHNNQWMINAHVDVLETYKSGILNNNAVIRRQEYIYNLYLDDPDFKTYNYEVIKTIQFTASSDLNKTLQYVLVTNNKPAASA